MQSPSKRTICKHSTHTINQSSKLNFYSENSNGKLMRRIVYSYFALFLILASCATKDKPVQADVSSPALTDVVLTDEQFKNSGIRLGHAEQRSISGVVKANGMLDVPPQNLVTVSAPMGGFVKNTTLLQGMKVQKGQVIITLEHPDYIQLQQDYLENK